MDEKVIRPMMPCTDYWKEKIPQQKLLAYKVMIDEGQITKPDVKYNKSTGATLVSYLANQPHEWVLERLKKIAEEWT